VILCTALDDVRDERGDSIKGPELDEVLVTSSLTAQEEFWLVRHVEERQAVSYRDGTIGGAMNDKQRDVHFLDLEIGAKLINQQSAHWKQWIL
jgi:hypothetical protein